jgi:hypothetical protein
MHNQPDEIIVLYPRKSLLEHGLNELLHGSQLEVMLQEFCSEGAVDDFWVEDRDGKVFATWSESVHSGCRDIQYINKHEIELTYQFTEEGIRFFVAADARNSSEHWTGHRE